MTLPTAHLAQTKDAFWVQGPLGPFLGNGPIPCRHLGLSYDQWASIATFKGGNSPYLKPTARQIVNTRFPAYLSNYIEAAGADAETAGWGDLDYDEIDGFGDVCSRTKRRYKKKKALLKKKKKQFKKRGRRFLGIRTGSGKKRLATIRRRMAKIKAKARKKGCYWASKKKKATEKQIAAEKVKQKQLETRLEKEHSESQAKLEAATAEVMAAGKTAGPNPLLVVGLVAGAGILMIALARKGKK